MKRILTAALFLTAFSVSAANITCITHGSSSYPISKDAMKLARRIGVKTCDGKKFKGAVKMLKQTIVEQGASAKQIAVIETARSGKLNKRLTKKLRGFTFN